VTGAPRGVLTDFGGVLTSSVFEAFQTYSAAVSGDPELLASLFRDDPAAGALLVEHECGRIDQAAFEHGIAALVAPRGIDLPAPGFLDAFQALLKPDEEMLAALAGLRAAGVPVAIVSNSLGDDCYRGYDLTALADVAVISSEAGVRKPSRAIYELACTRLGLPPADCVMIDDLEHNLRGAARLGIRGLPHTDTAGTITALAEWFGDIRLIPKRQPPTVSGVQPLRDRLRAALPTALKNRDRATASTLRATLAAIENAEAVDAGSARAGAIESSPVGLGVAEAARRDLTEADVAAIVRAEIDERRHAAAVYDRSGHADRAAGLRTAADMLAGFLE